MGFAEVLEDKVRAVCRAIYAVIVKGSPPEPCEEVITLFAALSVPKREQLMMYSVFHELKQSEEEDVVKTATAVKMESIYELVTERRRWVEKLLASLLKLGGCEEEEDVSWDSFLYILLEFCSLSKVELCQALFLMILNCLDSKVHHYLTLQQLIDFYSFYGKCPVTSFNTRAIDFTRLPLRRYYVQDFTELVQRFTVLLNPTIHLQRSLQEFLPSVEFWDNHHRSEVIIRKITYDFFLMEKTRCFLWGEPPFRESCDMLAPEALGFITDNKDQWELRTFDLHESVGALSENGSFSKDGQFMAPPGFQYRSLRQFSVWGEQPSPEETERMMLMQDENVYLTASGYIAQHVDKLGTGLGDSDDEDEDAKAKKKKKLEEEEANEEDEGDPEPIAKPIGKGKKGAPPPKVVVDTNPLNDPNSCCLRAACLPEDTAPPPTDMPPTWMKGFAIAPAPRKFGADPPLTEAEDRGTAQGFWGTGQSFGASQMTGGAGASTMNGFGMNQTNGSWGKAPGAPPGAMGQTGGTDGKMRSSKVKFADQ